MEYFDSHAHYDDTAFNEDREDILNKIYKANVTKCIDVGASVETSEFAIKIAKEHDFVYAICGIHPSEIANSKEEILKEIDKIRKMILENKKVVAIGEIGLDYHYEGYDKELQQFAFIEQIKLANELGLPICIHTRDAIDDTIAVIRKYEIKNGGVLHCCPFNRELVKQGLEKGLYVAFGGSSTFKSSKNASEIVNMVPDDKILIETDCPYLSPEPVRGTRNDSSNLKYIVQKLAGFKNMSSEEIAKITYDNGCKLFLKV